MRQVIISISMLAVSACATDPNLIKADKVDAGKFASMTCDQLWEQASRTNSELTPLLAGQKKTSQNDFDGVLLVGLPVGTMVDKSDGKERETRIAAMKGELVAINSVRSAKGCKSAL